MKKTTRIQIGMDLLAILLTAFLVTGCMEGAYVTEKITTSGVVAVKDTDTAGKIKSVKIKADEKPEIIVENSGKGKELIGMIGKKVEVSGMARGSGEAKQITVESYKVID